MGADKMLVKPMQTAILIRQIEKLLDTHSAKLQRLANSAAAPSALKPPARRLRKEEVGSQAPCHQEASRQNSCRPQEGGHQETQALDRSTRSKAQAVSVETACALFDFS